MEGAGRGADALRRGCRAIRFEGAHIWFVTVTFSDMPQISRGKFDRLRYATAGFTTGALDGYGLHRPLPLRPPPYASYSVLVHRLASLLHASFGPRLAARVISPLRFAITSRPSRCGEDLHLQAVEHARHITESSVACATEPHFPFLEFIQADHSWGRFRPCRSFSRSSTYVHIFYVFLLL